MHGLVVISKVKNAHGRYKIIAEGCVGIDQESASMAHIFYIFNKFAKHSKEKEGKIEYGFVV